jgi:hypothetical protein
VHNILHERKGRSRIGSAITYVNSELGSFPVVGHLQALFSSARNVCAISLRQKSGVPHPIDPCGLHLISLALRLLDVRKRRTARCSILQFFSRNFSKNDAPHNDAPYGSISVNFLLLDSPFRKEYRYGLIISPFSTAKKQQERSRTYRRSYVANRTPDTHCNKSIPLRLLVP